MKRGRGRRMGVSYSFGDKVGVCQLGGEGSFIDTGAREGTGG